MTANKFHEAVGHVYINSKTHLVDEKEYRRVIIKHGLTRLQCLIEEPLHSTMPPLSDGVFVRAQLVRSYGPDPFAEWLVLGMAKANEVEIRPFDLLPVTLCQNECVLGFFYQVNTTFKHPGLKRFLTDLFANPEFANALVMAPLNPWKAPRAHGIFEEVVYALLRLDENPFLTEHQKEVARVAVIFSRAGRIWCGAKNPDQLAPPALRLNRQVVGWMSKNHPGVFQRLVDIWKLIDNPDAQPTSFLPNEMVVAVWMALELSREVLEPELTD